MANRHAVIFITGVILLAHFISPPTYQCMENTISELAAQGYENAWVMRIGFVGFGALLAWSALVTPRMGKISKWLIALYAISILGSGIMSTSPFETGIAFSLQEAQFHSAFATIAGFALSFAMLASILETSQPKHKSIHLIALVLTLLLSITFGFAENGAIAVGRGVVQRGLYLVGFAWLVLYEQLSHPHDTRPSPSHT